MNIDHPTIRAADRGDFARLTRLSSAFWKTTRYANTIPFDLVTNEEVLHACWLDNLLIVLEVHNEVVGFTAATLSPILGNATYKHATELAFYIDPVFRGAKYAGKLLDALELAARAAGAVYLNMVSLEGSSPERVGAIYEARGFSKSETVYVKEL